MKSLLDFDPYHYLKFRLKFIGFSNSNWKQFLIGKNIPELKVVSDSSSDKRVSISYSKFVLCIQKNRPFQILKRNAQQKITIYGNTYKQSNFEIRIVHCK